MIDRNKLGKLAYETFWPELLGVFNNKGKASKAGPKWENLVPDARERWCDVGVKLYQLGANSK